MSFEKSLGGEETRAGSEDSPGAKPKKQIRLRSSHATPGAQLSGTRLLCSVRVDKIGAAKLTHVTPKVRSRTRVEAAILILALVIIATLVIHHENKKSTWSPAKNPKSLKCL